MIGADTGGSSRASAPTEGADGFGQSWIDDLRFVWRFRACRGLALDWRVPADAERVAIDGDHLLGRFGDFTDAVAEVAGRTWIVRSRIWHGWPDPPQYVFFAREPDGTIWCARDFDRWPGVWTLPQSAN